MPNLWFRLYSEFEDDPKVQMLPEHMQRRLIMLFCQRCKEEHRTEAQIAFKWHVSLAEVAETKALFVENGFIDNTWNLMNWNRRQFVSDSSTDRTRRYRERCETSQERHGNATVTVCDGLDTDTETDTETDSDTEQIQKESIAPSSPELNADASPIGTLPCVGKGAKLWPFYQTQLDEWAEAYPGIEVIAQLRSAKQWLIANKGRQKTFTGMPRYINAWLARAQNEAGRNGNGSGKHSGLQSPAIERQNRTLDNLKQVMESSGDYSPGRADSQNSRLLPEPGAKRGDIEGIPPGADRDRH